MFWVVDAGQAKNLDARVLRFQALHQRCECGFQALVHDHRLLKLRRLMKVLGVVVLQYPFNHGPGHDWKTRHKMHTAPRNLWAGARKTGDFVVGVGNELRACR